MENKLGPFGMQEIDSLEDFQTRQEQVISKFSKDFFEGRYLHNPMFHACVQMLIRGADPYAIIAELIKIIGSQDKRL